VDTLLQAELVKIKMTQHIGVKAVPKVKKGDTVKYGSKIADAVEDKLSLPVHSSLNGEVIEVTEDYIIIRNSNERM
jgi:Na+-translocating ferredoxin:NAD+ oxidoreductase RnfC subunit